MKNMIENQLTEADRTVIDKAINDLQAVLQDKLIALTEEERVKYGSVNEQNKLLVNKVRDYQQNNPAMGAPDVNWTEFESDYQARAYLDSLIQRLESLVYRMRSTKILHDYDNYQDSLTDYAYSQYKRGANESGFAEKVAEIKQFFPKSSKPKPPEDVPNP